MVIIAEAESDKEVVVDLLLSHGLPSRRGMNITLLGREANLILLRIFGMER